MGRKPRRRGALGRPRLGEEPPTPAIADLLFLSSMYRWVLQMEFLPQRLTGLFQVKICASPGPPRTLGEPPGYQGVKNRKEVRRDRKGKTQHRETGPRGPQNGA